MDYIKILREDNDLSDLLCDVCDIEILPEFKIPQDEDGHITYNISGKTFAMAGSGSEYILLEDGSIGYWGSEGECGRIADNLKEFFEFMVNCPYWLDYLDEEKYCDRECLEDYVKKNISINKSLVHLQKKSLRNMKKMHRKSRLICVRRNKN